MGSKSITLSPDADHYSIRLPSLDEGGRGSKLELRIVENSERSADEEQDEDTRGRKALATANARAYLQQHQLMEYVQGMLGKVVQEQPRDPWDYTGCHHVEALCRLKVLYLSSKVLDPRQLSELLVFDKDLSVTKWLLAWPSSLVRGKLRRLWRQGRPSRHRASACRWPRLTSICDSFGEKITRKCSE